MTTKQENMSVEQFIASREELSPSKAIMLRYLDEVSDSVTVEPQTKGRSKIHCEFDCGVYKGSEVLTFHMKTINPIGIALALMRLTSGHRFSYDDAEDFFIENDAREYGE